MTEKPGRVDLTGASIQSELQREGIEVSIKYINNLKKTIKAP